MTRVSGSPLTNLHQIWGIDFTSAPTQRKPIVAAQATLTEGRLTVERLHYWSNFSLFEEFLKTTNQHAWTGAVDIPLGMPIEFLKGLQWLASNWETTLITIGTLNKSQFKHAIATYQQTQPIGQKQPKRLCDRLAKAQSPTKLHYIPTALMLYEGASRIANARQISVWPSRVIEASNQRLIEGYPAQLLRALAANSKKTLNPYKSDSKSMNTHTRQREWLVDQLFSCATHSRYGVTLHGPEEIRHAMIEDSTGDTLDAVACCVQAAWAYRHWERLDHYFPHACPVEGWIVDPALRKNYSRHINEAIL